MKMSAICAATVAVLAGGAVSQADFIPGNLVVVTMNGTTSAGTAVSLREFTLGGVPVSTTSMPTSASGANRSFVDSGSASSDGFLSLSSNGQYLTLTGYDAAVGLASVASASGINRVVARVGFDQVPDTSTSFIDGFVGNNIRSSATVDGSGFWVTGAGTGGGVRYISYGASTSTQLATNLTNTRVVSIYNGQLYVSAASGAFQGLSTVGSGLPTSSGNTITALAGFPTASGPQNYDFFFVDANTVYIADDRATGSGGGLQKWTFSGSAWSLASTFNSGLTAGLRGLTGVVDGLGVATLYATTADASANKLVSFTEAGGFTTLATASAGTLFRGVDFTPVPAPASAVLFGLGSLCVARRRR